MRRFNSILSSNAPKNPRNLALFGEWPIRYSKLGDIAPNSDLVVPTVRHRPNYSLQIGDFLRKNCTKRGSAFVSSRRRIATAWFVFAGSICGVTKPHLPKFAPAMDSKMSFGRRIERCSFLLVSSEMNTNFVTSIEPSYLRLSDLMKFTPDIENPPSLALGVVPFVMRVVMSPRVTKPLTPSPPASPRSRPPAAALLQIAPADRPSGARTFSSNGSPSSSPPAPAPT